MRKELSGEQGENTEGFCAIAYPYVIQRHQVAVLGAEPSALSLGCFYTEAARNTGGFSLLGVSTLVGQHCKGCQQILIKTTTNKVWGHRQMALLAYLKWVCHHKAWIVQKTSQTDG